MNRESQVKDRKYRGTRHERSPWTIEENGIVRKARTKTEVNACQTGSELSTYC